MLIRTQPWRALGRWGLAGQSRAGKLEKVLMSKWMDEGLILKLSEVLGAIFIYFLSPFFLLCFLTRKVVTQLNYYWRSRTKRPISYASTSLVLPINYYSLVFCLPVLARLDVDFGQKVWHTTPSPSGNPKSAIITRAWNEKFF